MKEQIIEKIKQLEDKEEQAVRQGLHSTFWKNEYNEARSQIAILRWVKR